MGVKTITSLSFMGALLWGAQAYAQATPAHEDADPVAQASWTSLRVTGLMLDLGRLGDDSLYAALFGVELSHQRPSGLVLEAGLHAVERLRYNGPVLGALAARLGYAFLVKGQPKQPWRGYFVPLVGYRFIYEPQDPIQLLQGGFAFDLYEGAGSLFTFRSYGLLDYDLSGAQTSLGLNVGVSLGISLGD